MVEENRRRHATQALSGDALGGGGGSGLRMGEDEGMWAAWWHRMEARYGQG
jgi:hypothetical protein